MHDAQVLANSSLYRKATNRDILFQNVVNVNGTNIPIFLIGDPAYPLRPWPMKPFPHNSTLSRAQRSFNFHLSSSCIVVENAFGRLKARWWRLCKLNDMHIDNVPNVLSLSHLSISYLLSSVVSYPASFAFPQML